MDFKDYYATLGVPKTASEKEIKQAFRKLARKHHPDVNPGDKVAESKFKEINEAYEVLGDSDKRKKYDELGANWRMYEQQARTGGQPFGGGWSPGQGGARTSYRTMTPEEMEDLFGDSNPFSDFFTTFFGGEGFASAGSREPRGARGRRRPGRDIENEIELNLEDAYHGATRRLLLRHDGQAKHVDVRIPAGVTDGSRVRVSGEGEQGVGGAESGHLYLRVRLAPHPSFERKGRDIYVKTPVPLTTAVLGGEANVPTVSGKPARLRIPPLTQNGQLFRLKGYGMPAVGKSDETGDLYARVDVQLPTRLNDQEREHFEALKRLGGDDSKTHSAA
ncbi:MAG TPA: DnaJ C-terminal domain-containing protein [Vicinamibacterales bacterium]|nr:DnaJ C-terminal domain-containing protein [Vicinamibacterales bacterium]